MSETETMATSGGAIDEAAIVRIFASRVESVEFVRRSGDLETRTVLKLRGEIRVSFSDAPACEV